MKKIYVLAAFAGALLMSVACSGGHSHEHDHAEEGHDHKTELHNHEGEDHNHEGHNHEAEGHDHDHEAEEHDHASEMPGEHNHEGEAHGDDIVLTPEKAQAAGVVAKEVQPGRFCQVIRTSGEVMAAQGNEATVVATTSGVVSFPSAVVEGRNVSRGTNLVVIASKHLPEGDPAERARVAYETAKEEFDRASQLVESDIVSRQEYASIKEKYENARISYEALAVGAGANGQRVQAPIGGYVKSCLVKEGDYVTVGQPLMTITQNRRLFLRAEVSERYYKALRTITTANFKTPYDDEVYRLSELHGKVLSYGKSSDTDNFYLPITFEFDNKGDIVPGSFVEVFLFSSEMENVLSLPKTAITEEQGLNFVYLQLDAECYKKQEVKLGADNGKEVQVLSGLKPGDRVVVEGAYHVKLASASNAIPAHSHEH